MITRESNGVKKTSHISSWNKVLLRKLVEQRSGDNCSNVPINMEILRSELMQQRASIHHTNRWVAALETS
jgi:hypothetical protein